MRPPRLLIALLAILVAAAIVWRIPTRPRVTRPDAVDAANESHAAPEAPSAETHPAIAPRLVSEDDVEWVDSGSEDAAPAAVSDPLKVRILVVDAAGVRPPGVPVATVNPVLVATRRGVTGPDGIAEVGVPFRNATEEDGSNEPRVHAVLAIPADPPVFQTFDPRAIPDAPIKLVLPPTEAVRVRLVKPDGTAFDGPATVALELAHEGWDDSIPSGTRTMKAVPVAGSALFERVGLSQDLTVEVEPEDPALRSITGNIPAPRERGTETVLTLTCGGHALLVSGRLVTPEGDPIRTPFMIADLCGGSLSLRTHGREAGTKTDDAGRFSLRFDLDPASAAAGEIRVEVRLHDGPGRATVPLPKTGIGGSFEAGDVIVTRPILLAAGQVVDSEGHPVAGAHVSHDEIDGWRPSTAITLADASGRFELRGATAETKFAVTANLGGWICLTPTLCDRGAKDIRVVMTRAGGLAGALIGIDRLQLRLQPPIQVVVAGPGVDAVARVVGGSHPAGMDLPVFSDGQFSAWGLLPGRYSVLFLGVGVREPLFVVNDVVVVGGEVNRDPRLQNVDLASLLKVRTVTVLDEQQRPLAEVSVGARMAGGAAGSFATFVAGRDGRADMMMPPGPLELVAVRRGYRSAVLTMTTDSATLTMQKASPRPVTIKLIEDCAILVAPFQLMADVRHLGPLTGSSRRESDPTDPRNDLGADFTALGRSTQVTVGEPGIYEVRLWLYYTGRGGRESSAEAIAQTGGNLCITVGETGDSSVTVAPDPKALEQAIERARIR